MNTIEGIVKAEYDLILNLWKFERKWLEKIPLGEADWREMNDEANKIAETRKGESQDKLCSILSAFMDEIEFIDKKMKEAKK